MIEGPPGGPPLGEAATAAVHDEVGGVARGGALNIAGAALNAGMRVLVTLIIGRALGDRAVGLYYQAFAVHDLLALVAAAGFTTALTRFVALHRSEGDAGSLRGIVRLGLAFSTSFAALAGVVLFLLAPWLAADVFGDAPMEKLLMLVAVVMPVTVFKTVALSATQGFKTMRYYAGIQLVFEPVFRLALTGALLLAGGGVREALIALVVTNVLGALLAAGALRRLMGRPTAPPVYHVREAFSFSFLSWATTLAVDAYIWADTIMLGIFRGPEDVGVYQVATRLVLLSAIFVAPIGLAFAPRIADLYQRRERETLARTYHTVSGWIMRLAVFPFVVLVLFPDQLLGIFGGGFPRGASVTIILAFGALAHASTGPSITLLNMMGRPGMALANNVATIIVNIGLNLWLIPAYGIVGAAVGWLCSIVFSNALVAWQIRATLGTLPFGLAQLKSIAAGALSLAAAAAAQQAVRGPAGLALSALLIPIVYVGASVLFKLSRDDRMVLRAFKRRLSSA